MGEPDGTPVATAAVKPGGDVRYSTTELAEIDTMALLKSIREQYAVDSDRIYLMGHSMGGAGTYLGGKYNDIWAALAPISGAGGIADGTAERYKSLPTLIMHGAKDSIVPPATSRRAVAALQAVGAPHIKVQRRLASRVSGTDKVDVLPMCGARLTTRRPIVDAFADEPLEPVDV